MWQTCPKGVKKEACSVGRKLQWQFSEKLGFNRTRLWYEHEPESVVGNKISKFCGISPYSMIT